MILVTGATGQCGGALARLLARQGERVRGLTRNLEQPAVKDLLSLGVEVVRGDMLAPGDLNGLFADVDRAFLVTTPQAGFEEEVLAGINFVSAAKANNIRHLVFLSVIFADTDTPHCSTKGKIETYIKDSGVSYTILRAGYFLNTLPNYFSESDIRRRTIMSVIKPDAPIYWITIEDIGRAAGLVISRNRPENRTYDLVGPQAFSMEDVARVFGEVKGIDLTVEYTPVSTQDLLRGLVAAGYLDREKALRYLQSSANPEADYHAAASHADLEIDTKSLAEETGLSFVTAEAYVRELTAAMPDRIYTS
jgi:uncharacterized protein YbjT (DUF2867 family)